MDPRITQDQARALREDPAACARRILDLGPDVEPGSIVVDFLRAVGQVFDGAPEGARLALDINRRGLLGAYALPEDVNDPTGLNLPESPLHVPTTEEAARGRRLEGKARAYLLRHYDAEEVDAWPRCEWRPRARTKWKEEAARLRSGS